MARTVLITGAARGIGRAILERYQCAEHEVVAPTRQELDLSSIDSVQQYLRANAGLTVDVLVNNAGQNPVAPLQELSLGDWEQTQTVNLTAPLLLIQHVAEHMVQRRWGRIVNISSCYSLVGRAGRGPYSASKAGLNALTRTAALEYAQTNVLVNAVAPGFVATDLTYQNNTPAQIEALCEKIPVERLATPDEIAELVFFLGSDQNTYITGQVLVADGGFTIQ